MKHTLSQALKLIKSHINSTLESEYIQLKDGRGRICAKDIFARYPIPTHDISLRDGYCVKKNFSSPLLLEDLQMINTGSLIPKDTLCIIEHEKITSPIISQEMIQNAIKNLPLIVKPKGEDIKKEELLVKRGKKIGAFDIANLTSQGICEVCVYKKVQIAYIGVGDEIVDVHQPLLTNQVYNSNAYTIALRAQNYGAKDVAITHVKSDLNSLKEIIQKYQHCDAIITIGSMSRGDTVDEMIKSGFTKEIFKGVKLAPAGLSGLSFFHNTPILHLPGLPMSALLGFEVLGVPIIQKLYGEIKKDFHSIHTLISKDIAKSANECIIPGFFDGSCFKPKKVKAGMMNVLNNCNGYILPNQKKPLKKGERIKFHPFIPWNT